MTNLLSIIIPCKNEEKYIGLLLSSLLKQTYDMSAINIFIANAGSTDRTLEVINQYSSLLNIRVIPGGLPAIGRNAGARLATTKYLLFLDADIVLEDKNIISRTVSLAEQKNLDLVTVSFQCNTKDRRAQLLYSITNRLMQFSKYFNSPFVTGMYFFIRRDIFNKFNGFPENIIFAEDYALSKKISGYKFKFLSNKILVTNRRFKTTGYFQMIKLVLITSIFPQRTALYKKYWETPHD